MNSDQIDQLIKILPAVISICVTGLVTGFTTWLTVRAEARRNKIEVLKEKDAWIRTALEDALFAADQRLVAERKTNLSLQNEEIDTAKKKFASEVAREYLSQFDIEISPRLLDALIDAQIMRRQYNSMT